MAFNWVALSAVPYTIDVGVAQDIVGFVLLTVSESVVAFVFEPDVPVMAIG